MSRPIIPLWAVKQIHKPAGPNPIVNLLCLHPKHVGLQSRTAIYSTQQLAAEILRLRAELAAERKKK